MLHTHPKGSPWFNCIKDIQYEFAGISVLEFRILTNDPWFLGCLVGSLFGSWTFWLVVRVWDGGGVGTVEPLDQVIPDLGV